MLSFSNLSGCHDLLLKAPPGHPLPRAARWWCMNVGPPRMLGSQASQEQTLRGILRAKITPPPPPPPRKSGADFPDSPRFCAPFCWNLGPVNNRQYFVSV